MKRICCIGHITLDKIVNPQATTYQNGGTSYYFAHGMAQLPEANFQLVTALAETEMNAVEELRRKGTDVVVFPSRNTVYFENCYGKNQDNRTQRVLAKADAFDTTQMTGIKADIYHLGSLLADDFPLELVKLLASKGIVSLDVQGYLRRVTGTQVEACAWEEKQETLKYVDILKVNEHEMEVLTGETDPMKAALILSEWGVKEILLTMGSQGSYIYVNGEMITVPAYTPRSIVDATGCGDTYMTGYLYQRAMGVPYYEAGCFAAAMSSLKLEHYGPFCGSIDDIKNRIRK